MATIKKTFEYVAKEYIETQDKLNALKAILDELSKTAEFKELHDTAFKAER